MAAAERAEIDEIQSDETIGGIFFIGTLTPNFRKTMNSSGKLANAVQRPYLIVIANLQKRLRLIGSWKFGVYVISNVIWAIF